MNRVRAVIKLSDKIFLVQHTGQDSWCLPGGKVEEGEALKPALERELMEELGVKAEIGKLVSVQQFKHEGTYYAPEFFFEVLNSNDFVGLDISGSSHGDIEIQGYGFKTPSETENLRPRFIPELLKDGEIKVVLG
jgi:ADP-ribose pyrophosphatase YjhB (NUDIX family)